MERSFKLKNCDRKTINTVNGYISEIQKLFPWQRNSYFIIPELINHICLSFYWIRFVLKKLTTLMHISDYQILMHKNSENPCIFNHLMFNREYAGQDLEFIDDTTVTKIRSNAGRICAIGESISNELCDIFRIEYLLKDYDFKYCPYMGFLKLKCADESDVDFDSLPGCLVNKAHMVGMTVSSVYPHNLAVLNGDIAIGFELEKAAEKGDRFMIEFDFIKSEFYVYHNGKKIQDMIIKVDSLYIIPLLALYFKGEIVEVTKYEFVNKS